ncbi:ras association domain-containing protein 4-like [Pyxicephalus adspersus]|uniref:ras association domain-containing protein 4-like n=1 Tax=Pyxicephalus adspersus TaxID=30357 RepID=UPI003B59CBB4
MELLGKHSITMPIAEKQSSEEEQNNNSGRNLGEEEITPQLKRTRSDASFVQRRSKHKSPEEAQRLRSHRFSINGHFYDHKTSVFTPAYGSVTNVRVTSTMNTSQVLNLLLKKFRVENSPSEFGLYYLHETGERSKLGDTEFPLICRILHGPCERIARLFIMETDLGVEVSHDVAQYIKFEMPVLCSFVEKLKEEEDREINKLTQRYNAFRMMMLERLEELTSYESYA